MQWLPLSRHSAQTSPGTTRFFLSIHPLHLPYMIPCSYRASACKAVLPSCMAFYVISVRQTGDLPVVSLFPHPASFRFHLAMDTLTFGYILPTTGRIRDLHPLETCAAGRTLPKNTGSAPSILNGNPRRRIPYPLPAIGADVWIRSRKSWRTPYQRWMPVFPVQEYRGMQSLCGWVQGRQRTAGVKGQRPLAG